MNNFSFRTATFAVMLSAIATAKCGKSEQSVDDVIMTSCDMVSDDELLAIDLDELVFPDEEGGQL